MAKAIIVYESKYGNTKRVAETIAEGMKEAGIETAVVHFKEADLDQVAESDAVLVGSPNHIGKATRGIRKFISKLDKANLEGKLAAAFDTYVGDEFGKAMKKMEQQISEKVPGLKLAAPGLSVRVEGTKGPVAEEELTNALCREFGAKIAAQVAAESI